MVVCDFVNKISILMVSKSHGIEGLFVAFMDELAKFFKCMCLRGIGPPGKGLEDKARIC